MSLLQLFPDSDSAFQIRFERETVQAFFGPTADSDRILAERRQWLAKEPNTYAAVLPEGDELLEEAAPLLHSGNPLPGPLTSSALDRCLALGRSCEPDFLLLKADNTGQIRLWAACVCFPSSWSLNEKMGESINVIHSPVPGLNSQIGPQIHAFLTKLRPGVAWLRRNWGLSRSPELNQHPTRPLPRLDATVRLDEVWLRVEHQALVALPRTRGILFGIRLAIDPLREVLQDPQLRERFGRALRTMPEAVAHYKGLAAARRRVLDLLNSSAE